MAEEKPKKINLRDRLGKTQVGGAPGRQSAPPGGLPPPAIPPPAITGGVPPPVVSGGIPAPPFAAPAAPAAPPKPAQPTVDPTNPYATVQATQAPPKAAEIKIDESAVHDAKKGMQKFIVIAGVAGTLIGLALGNVVGSGSVKSDRTKQAREDATKLADDIEKANVKITELRDKILEANKSLKEKKFPENFSKELGGINIPFDGTKFSGKLMNVYPERVFKSLINYASNVEALNNRKDALRSLFNSQKAAIVSALESGEKPKIGHAVIILKNQKGAAMASIVPIPEPFEAGADWPKEFKFINPVNRQALPATRYESGEPFFSDQKKLALPVDHTSVAASFPSDVVGKIMSEVVKTGELLNGKAEGEDVDPGLIKEGEELVKALKKIGSGGGN